MKSTDERMHAVLGRARAHEVAIRRRRQRAAALGGGALSVIIMVAVGMGVSSVMGESSGASSAAEQLGLMGSVFSGSSALGYIVVGLLGIVIGAAVAAVAFRLGHGKQAIGVQKLPEAAISHAKPQVAEIASENLDTDSSEGGEGRAP